jgi:hypothetical protein
MGEDVPMDLRTDLRYDADPVTVFAMLTDEAFLARKAHATGAVRHRASVTRDGDRVTVRLLRVMPPEVPDFVRRLVGETIDLDQVDIWEPAARDGSRTGSIRIVMAGAPVTLTGGMSLVGAGSSSAATDDALVRAVRVEESVGRAWLAEERSR